MPAMKADEAAGKASVLVISRLTMFKTFVEKSSRIRISLKYYRIRRRKNSFYNLLKIPIRYSRKTTTKVIFRFLCHNKNMK